MLSLIQKLYLQGVSTNYRASTLANIDWILPLQSDCVKYVINTGQVHVGYMKNGLLVKISDYKCSNMQKKHNCHTVYTFPRRRLFLLSGTPLQLKKIIYGCDFV